MCIRDRRTVKNASVIRNNEIIEFTFEADGFLYNMVRIMVGTLLDINRGKDVYKRQVLF